MRLLLVHNKRFLQKNYRSNRSLKTDRSKGYFADEYTDPRLTDTIAKEIDAKVLIVNPIEIVIAEEQSENKDYFSKMYENLNNLKVALECVVE